MRSQRSLLVGLSLGVGFCTVLSSEAARAQAAPEPPPSIVNTNTANPTNTVTANPTNTNDNRSSAQVTNNNTIYIYPPAYPPPPPPPVAAPMPPMSAPLPPLIPAPPYRQPAYAPSYAPTYAPAYRQPLYAPPRRIRLTCGPMCGQPTLPPPRPVVSPLDRSRYVSLGGQFTVLGMADQPLAGWGTLYGGGIQLQVRSRGRFGFEMSQDFLHGTMKQSSEGQSIERKSYPFEVTLRGYILPNQDRYHFNVYFGGGFGAMVDTLDLPGLDGRGAHQDFLEWMLHADLGAELKFKWIALGVDGRALGLVRDRNFGDGALYGEVKHGPVPSSTWGLQGRAYVNLWF